MAELYENPRHYVTEGGTVGDSANGAPTFERMLADLPPEEREEAMKYITAPPSGEEIMRAMQEKNSKGEVMNMTLDQYRLFKAHNKTKEVDVIAGIGEAAGTVFEEISKAAGSIIDNPVDSVKKLTPSVIEAFAQGTRNLYGMAAQSADPNSVFFRMKNALQANGDDEEAEYQQFMEAQAFNVHSMRLMTGQDTIIMDKDIINPEMTQVMSYIADPTLFIPFGGWAAKGATMVGMGEKLAMAAARTQGIRNLVLGGAIKWGVGAPLEFMGGAIRNTIDYGIDTGSRVFETATGVAAKDIASATRVGTLGTAAGSVAGLEVNSSLAQVSKYYTGSLVARNVGEAASVYGEQMMKQGKTGRGVLGYAGQAIRDTERQGIKLAPQTKSLLKAIEAVDPLFVYADDIAQGAAQGAIIGGGLGYLAGGEEGFAGGVGSGMALGTVGATAGKVVADVTGNTKIDQMRIQRKLVIEALKEQGNENAVGFEAMAAMAEATGDRAFMGYIDGIIAGIDTVNPDAVFKAYNDVQYNMHLKAKGIDPSTGVLLEKSRIFPELNDRTVKADVLGILRDTGNRFAGDPAGFEQAIKNAPEFAKLKPVWSRLDDNAKAVILKQVKDNGDPAFVKGLRGRQLNAHWGDLSYAERLADMINSLNQKNSNSVPDKIRETLKAETRSDKKLTRRGQMLKEKLQADGYIDKDGNIRQRRLTDVEGTQGEFEASAGWAKSRDSTGRTEVVINLDKWAMDSGNRLSLAHELYHSIMLDSVFAPDYIDRLSQKLLGKFDPKTGRVLEQALVPPNELMKFFGKYIENDPSNRGDAETIKRKKEELKKSIEDYRTRGTANRVADATAIPLEHLVEEFGAYYFSKWVKAQPIDYMFRGGEFGGIRGLMEMASDGWLDYWKGKVGEKNPQFNFDGMGVSSVSKAFEKDGKRVSSRSLDLFMRDIVRIEANRNSNNGFDVNKLSKESREWFLKVNGLRGAAFGQLDQQGNVKKPRLRRYTAEEIRQGKEMFKVLESLPDAAHKDGMRRDGDGNWSGQPNTAQINALVGAGYIQRAWFDRMTRAYDIVNGNGSNVVEFGYLGYSAHIGDGNERVYGAAVPFKNRRAVLIGVDFKVRADGSVYSNLHTLDLKVIEARGNEVWKDPQTRELWKGSRTDMEADFYAYLSNASLPSDHPNRKPSARLLEKGDGLGGQRRDALHQMLGFHKNSDLPYINRPIAEIPVGIRHSVTTFSNDGIVNMRVDNKPRYDFNFENAHLDLSRNFMPDEMRQETTPSGGKIIKHATGYQISKQAGTKFKVFDPEGKHLGDFDTVADAGRAAQKHFNEAHEAKTEGVDPAVPRTEVPPSRVEYKDKRVQKILDDNKIEQAVIEALEKEISGITSKENYPESAANYYARPFINAIEAIKRDGLTKAVSNEDASHVKILQLQQIKPDVSSLGDIDIGIPHYAKELKVSYLLDKLTKLAQHEYDAMYPMEIKSALHGTLAQIFQDYPQITAKGLIGKIQKYGSLNKARLMQEATEIGLIDLLKSKPMATKIKKDIYRAYDRVTESFTGEVKVKETPIQYEPFVDIQEILDFAKSKEIKVTIEEGARERSGMDTSRYTLGGAKGNYKETAVRINPEYAHGISGHYGKDTIVHFRTTERIDADGNRHLFIEEVQANNTDKRKVIGRLTPEREFIVRKNVRTQKTLYNKAREEGIYVQNSNGEGFETQKTAYIKAKLWNSEKLNSEITLLIQEINPSQGYDAAMSRQDMRKVLHEGLDHVFTMIGTATSFGDFLNRLEAETESVFDNHFKVWKKLRLSNELLNQFNTIQKFEVERQKFYRTKAIESLIDEGNITNYTLDNPDLMLESIQDNESLIQLHELSLSQKEPTPLPLTAAKDWTLTALKGIIRQAIRDGLDKVTLTHPDDSPTVSHMKGDARRGLYGKLIPEVWGSWLRKYGIEMKQTNKLADATIDTAKGQMAEITNKLHDANKAVLEQFEQVKGGEDPATINNLAQLMATPVHEADGRIDAKIRVKALDINDNKLRDLINEVSLLKGAELNAYNKVQKLREGGIRAISDIKSDTDAGISAEAIDRGMTFELNDRIKREFLEGRINTHSMPSESWEKTRELGMKSTWNNLPEVSKKLLQLNIDTFGLTNNAYEAGYLLPDARMLDFSGRSQTSGFKRVNGKNVSKTKFDEFKDSRQIDHREAVMLPEEKKKMQEEYGWEEDKIGRMQQAGAIRIDHNDYGTDDGRTYLDIGSIPTNKQYEAILDILKNSVKNKEKHTLGVDIRVNGKAINHPLHDVNLENPERVILALKREVNKAYKNNEIGKDKASMQPAEGGEVGGRTYTPEQFKTKFIGRVAAENPERIKDLSIKVLGKKDSFEFYIYDKNFSDTTPIGEISTINKSSNNKDNIITKAYLKPEYRGKGFGKLLYSELGERLRSVGIENIEGTVTDLQNRPFSIRASVFGKDSTSRMAGTQDGVTTRLDPNARYQPDDYQGGDDYYKKGKRKDGVKIPKQYKDFPTSPEGVDEFGAKIRYVRYFDPKSGQIKEVENFPFTYMEIGHEINSKNVFLWSLNNANFKKYGVHENSPITIGSMASMMRDKQSPFHGYGNQSLSDVRGRIEMPVLDEKGNITEKGRVSIGVLAGAEGKVTLPQFRLLKEKIIKSLGLPALTEKDFDFWLYTADRDIRSQFGLSEKDKGGIKFQPDEGGRTYNDKQMSGEFIGRYASENPKATKGLKPKFNIFSSGDEGNIELVRGQDTLGYINFSFSKATGDALIEYTRVADKHQGKGYGNLLYSELVERLRSMGMKEVQGMIIDEQGRPQKIRERIIDKENARIGGDKTQIDYVEKDPDSDATQTGVTSYLYNDAWYQPDEPSIIGIEEIAEARRIGNLFKTKGMQEFVGDRELVPQTADEGFIDFINRFKEANINQQTALYMLDEMSKGMFGGLDRQMLRVRRQELIDRNPDAKNAVRGMEWKRMSLQDASEFKKIEDELDKPALKEKKHSDFTAGVARDFAEKISKAKEWVKKASPTYNDFSGYIADNVPMREYYQHAVYSSKFKTGQPVAVVGVHGTYTSQGFLKDKKYKHEIRVQDYPLEKGEMRGAYFASSDSTVLNPEYQGYDPKKLGYEIDPTFRRPESDKPNIAKSVIRFDNPLVVNGQFADIMKRTEKILGEAIEKGHDGVIYINQMDGGNLDVSFIVPADKANQHQRMIGSTREKNMEGNSYEPLPRGEGLTNRTANLQPDEYIQFTTEQTASGRILKNAKGYAIIMVNNKFRVYNPTKAILGVYNNEEEAKKRIYREIPKR